MKPNVFITARQGGKRVYCWEGHNTLTSPGRAWMAGLLALDIQDPDVSPENGRLKHMCFGVGGNRQSPVIDSTVDAAYPAGYDPYATNGRQYDHKFPIEPDITTLERPVRLTGGSNPYPSAAGSDVWLTDPTPPRFLVTNPSTGQASVRYIVDTSTELIYAPFTVMPLSELGLVKNDTADVNEPFNEVVAYVNFDTLLLSPGLIDEVEIIWVLNF